MKRLWIGLCAALMLVCSCEDPGALEQFGASTGELDSSKINERLDDLEDRVSKLETLCNTMNSNITALQTAVKALEGGDYITSVTPITENGVEVGYTITFAKNGTITLYHGKDGITPVIGVKQDTDGIWYWTLNGEWLLDEAGNKVKATGTDGQDGTPGQNGDDGKNGADGKDGVTPLLKIENDYWYVSYDNGATWTELGKAKGEDGADGEDGKDGEDGADGVMNGGETSLDSVFKSIYWDEQNVYFVLADGTSFAIPISKEQVLAIEFNGADSLDFNAGKPVSVNFEVTGASGIVTAETICENGWSASVEMTSAISGTITLTPPSPLRNGKMILFVTDAAGKVAMKSIVISPDFITAVSDVLAVSQKGGTATVTLTTNLDYTVNIEESAQSWISHTATKAVRTETLEFSVLENPADTARTGEIALYSEAANLTEVVTVFQYGKLSVPEGDDMTQLDTSMIITFVDKNVKAVLVANFDKNSDGEISIGEARAVTDLGTIFTSNDEIMTFEELQYFTSLTTICKQAFYGCGGLMKIKLPETVTKIDQSAFNVCKSLASIEIPSSVEEIASSAFYACDMLSKVSLNDGLGVIGDHAFAYCDILKEIDIPDTVYDLGASAFSGSGLQKAELSSSVVELKSSVFSSCEYLSEVILKEGLLRIKMSAFRGCSHLKSVTLPSTLVSLDDDCFKGCKQLLTINIPEGVTMIPYRCFYECVAIDDIVLHDKVTKIEGSAFYGCESLTGLVIPDSVVSLGSQVFDGCTSLKSIEIPSSITELPSYAFRNCTSLSSVTLPSNMTTIGSYAFQGCVLLTALDFPASLKSFGSNCLEESGIREFTLPSHMSLSYGMFRNCKYLEKVTLHQNLKEIGTYCFEGCSALKHIDIPTSVTTIGTSAFSASGLEEIVVPETVTSMASSIFKKCVSLRKAEINANVSALPISAFAYCDSLASFSLGDYITSIGSGAFRGCDALIDVVMPEQIASIDSDAFAECMSLRSFTYPSKVTSVSSYMFYKCPELKTIVFNENMTTIESNAFSGSGVEEVVIPDGVTAIDKYVFYGCSMLKNVTIPATVETLGASWINSCDALESITCLAVTPPAMSGLSLAADFTKIYVPSSSVEVYQAAAGWSTYADRITAIAE